MEIADIQILEDNYHDQTMNIEGSIFCEQDNQCQVVIGNKLIVKDKDILEEIEQLNFYYKSIFGYLTKQVVEKELYNRKYLYKCLINIIIEYL